MIMLSAISAYAFATIHKHLPSMHQDSNARSLQITSHDEI
jgi:hypothetical protein